MREAEITEIVDVELGHFYLPELLAEGPASGAGYVDRGLRRADALRQAGATVRFSLLIDDLGEEFSADDRARGVDLLRAELGKRGLDHVMIVNESACHAAAPTLLETLRGKYLLSADNASYFTVVSQDPFLWAQETLESTRSIKQMFLSRLRGRESAVPPVTQAQFLVPLHTPGDVFRPYGCSLLTAVWYLARLGVEGFEHGNEPSPERADRLVNVLPVKYLKSEGFALDLIRISSATRIRKAAKRIEYVLI